jgi:hypothetical protein
MVSASSPVAPAYQWQFDGTNLAGATGSTLLLTNIQPSQAGSYQVVITNTFGSVTSAPVTLTIAGGAFQFVVTGGLQLSTNGFKLQLSGLAGQGPVILQASSNLIDWSPIFTNPPAIGVIELVDPAATTRSARFYRALIAVAH